MINKHVVVLSVSMLLSQVMASSFEPGPDAEESLAKRRRTTALSEEVLTVEETTRQEYQAKWDRLKSNGLERRKEFLARNSGYQACWNLDDKLCFIIHLQQDPAFRLPLPMRNFDTVANLVDSTTGSVKTKLSELKKKRQISKEDASFFSTFSVTRIALTHVAGSLIDEKSYAEIIELMANDGVLEIPANKTSFLKKLTAYRKVKHYKDILDRNYWGYLKEGDASSVHVDDDRRVKDLILQHIEDAANSGTIFLYIASKKDDSCTLFGDFLNKYKDSLQRLITATSYREHMSNLLKEGRLSTQASLMVETVRSRGKKQ